MIGGRHNVACQSNGRGTVSPAAKLHGKTILAAILTVGLSESALFGIPAVATAATVMIEITGDHNFAPTTQVVKAGDTVVWINRSQLICNVTPDPNQVDPFQASGDIRPGQSYSATITGSPRSIKYYSKFHGAPGGRGMAGQIVVGP
jgi:plastocyanin